MKHFWLGFKLRNYRNILKWKNYVEIKYEETIQSFITIRCYQVAAVFSSLSLKSQVKLFFTMDWNFKVSYLGLETCLSHLET